MTLQLGDTRAGLRGGHQRGPDPLPRLARRLLGGAVLAPQGLHAGLHDRARLHGEDQARVRPPRREDHRPVGRPDATSTSSGRGHRGDPGHAPNYPIIGDGDFNVSKLYGMLPADVPRATRRAHPGRQPDGAQRLRDRPRQEDQADPRLPDDDRAQLRRGAARDRLAAADRQATRSPRRSTGSRART